MSNQQPHPVNDTPVASQQPQHMAFAHNAGIDLSALNGLNISAEQLMTIARLLQSGQLTLPPPAPGANSTPSALPVSAPIPPSAPAVAQQTSTPHATGGNDIDTDREEGELEDDQEPSRAHALTSVACSPSVMKQAAHAQTTRVNGSQNTASPHDRVGAQTSNAVTSRTSSIAENATGAPQPSLAVKTFILELYRVGYGYEDLAREVENTQALRNLYKQIGLPLTPVPSAPPPAVQQSIAQRGALASGQNIVATAPKALDDRQTHRKPSAVTSFKTPTSANAKPDRASYLAKLQAAKNKKSEAAVESPTTNTTQSPAVPLSTQAHSSTLNTVVPQSAASQQLSTPQNVVTTVTQPAVGAAAPPLPRSVTSTAAGSPARATKFTVDTELVRQRLAKLQAERAAAQNAHRLSNDATVTMSPYPQPEGNNEGVRLPSDGAAQPQHNAAAPNPAPAIALSSPVTIDGNLSRTTLPVTASPTLARGSGLPGLFTTKTLVQQSSSPVRTQMGASAPAPSSAPAKPSATFMGPPAKSPAQSPAPLNPPQQRPANGERALWNGSSAPKRGFGESRLQNEAFIIETSSDDDDDNDDNDDNDDEDGAQDMDIDSTGQQSPEPETKSVSARPVGPLPEFPPMKFDLQRAASIPGTPGTPRIDLKRKLEELELAKQKLEEMKRRKVVAKAAPSVQASSIQSPIGALTTRPSMPSSDTAAPNTGPSKHAPSAAIHPSKQQQKEALRKRLQELQDSMGATRPSASIAALPTSESSVQSVPDQSSGSANADDHDDDELYEPESVDPDKTSEPVAGSELHDSEEDDGEIYEPQSLGSVDNAEARPQLGFDGGEISPQGTTQSRTTNSDAADTQLNAEMDAAMAHDVNSINTDGLEHAAPSEQRRSDSDQIVQDPSHFDVAIEEGEVVDGDSENMYEPLMNDEPITAHPPQLSAASNTTTPAKVLEAKREEEDADGNQSMEISDQIDSDLNCDSSDDSSDEYEPEQGIIPEPITPQGSSSAAIDHRNEETNDAPSSLTKDKLAPELEPAAEQPANEQLPAVADSAPTGFYKPYTSALTGFREYRYHPSFIDTVPGGHKSLTYSNNIDLEKPICPFEIGGRCNDKDCQFQHFRTNNDLLREIGTRKIPAKGLEEEKKWRDGLTAVVHELRSTNRGKDVAVIAQRIAEYRREFRGDPTKTLLLD